MWFRSLMLGCLVVVTGARCADAGVAYSFMDHPTYQNGHSLTGTVTVADSAADDGLLTMDEIVSWSFEVSLAGTVVSALNSQMPSALVVGNGAIGISPSYISLPQPSPTAHSGLVFASQLPSVILSPGLARPRKFLSISTAMYAAAQHPSSILWGVDNPASVLGGEDWVIAASGSPDALPEPASLVVWGVLGLAGIGLARRKRRVRKSADAA